MYQVKFTTAYKRSYKLMKKRGFDISAVDTVVNRYVNNNFISHVDEKIIFF